MARQAFHEPSITNALPTIPRAHLGTAITAQDVAQGPDREPSSARSAFNCAGSVESVYARHCVRGHCEPRTARGPVAVSRCARRTQPPKVKLAKTASVHRLNG